MKTAGLIAWMVWLSGAAATAGVEAVGQASSEGPVILNGIPMDVAGVISWTILSGDVVSTDADAALILLRNGGRVILGAKSKLTIGRSRESLESNVTLLEGAANVSCPRDCRIALNARDRSRSLRRGDRVNATVSGENAALTPGETAPAFQCPAPRFVQRLPYTMGIHLPGHER